MANPFETLFKSMAAGAQTGLAGVAAAYANQQASQRAPSGAAGSGVFGAPSGRAGSGISQAAQSAARMRHWAETQRRMAEAQRRIAEEIQNQRNKEAWARLRNGKKVLDFGGGPDIDGDGFRWLPKPERRAPELESAPVAFDQLNSMSRFNTAERTFADLTANKPWENHPGLVPTIEQGAEREALAEHRRGEREAARLAPLANAPQLGPAVPPAKSTAQQEHLRGEKTLLPQAQIDVMVEPEFDRALGYVGAFKLYRVVRDTNDPEVRKYYEWLGQYNDDMVNGKMPQDPMSVEGDGDFGLTATQNDGNRWSLPGPNSRIFPYVLVQGTDGKFKMTYLPAVYNDLNRQAYANPDRAGELIVALAALGAYGGGSDKYAQDRVQVVTDKKTGKVKVIGEWSVDDAAKLNAFLPQLTAMQQEEALNGRIIGIEQLMAERALTRQNTRTTTATGGSDEYGGGGYRRYGGGGYGGGGGGYTSPVRLTDPTALKTMVDSIARQRTGGGLTDEQKAAFVEYVHSLERQSSAAYSAGGEFTTVDIEGQAINWVTTALADKAAEQAYGNYFMDFANFASKQIGGEL